MAYVVMANVFMAYTAIAKIVMAYMTSNSTDKKSSSSDNKTKRKRGRGKGRGVVVSKGNCCGLILGYKVVCSQFRYVMISSVA